MLPGTTHGTVDMERFGRTAYVTGPPSHVATLPRSEPERMSRRLLGRPAVTGPPSRLTMRFLS